MKWTRVHFHSLYSQYYNKMPSQNSRSKESLGWGWGWGIKATGWQTIPTCQAEATWDTSLQSANQGSPGTLGQSLASDVRAPAQRRRGLTVPHMGTRVYQMLFTKLIPFLRGLNYPGRHSISLHKWGNWGSESHTWYRAKLRAQAHACLTPKLILNLHTQRLISKAVSTDSLFCLTTSIAEDGNVAICGNESSQCVCARVCACVRAYACVCARVCWWGVFKSTSIPTLPWLSLDILYGPFILSTL